MKKENTTIEITRKPSGSKERQREREREKKKAIGMSFDRLKGQRTHTEKIGAQRSLSGGNSSRNPCLQSVSLHEAPGFFFFFSLKSKLNIFLLLRFICGSGSVMNPLHDDEEEEADENICLRSLMWLTWNPCMIVSQQQQRCAVFKTKLCLRRLRRAYKVLSFHTHIHFVDYNTYIHDT